VVEPPPHTETVGDIASRVWNVTRSRDSANLPAGATFVALTSDPDPEQATKSDAAATSAAVSRILTDRIPRVVLGPFQGPTLLKLSLLELEQAATRVAATRVPALYRIERRPIVARTAASPAFPSPYLFDSRQLTIADAAVGQVHLNG